MRLNWKSDMVQRCHENDDGDAHRESYAIVILKSDTSSFIHREKIVGAGEPVSRQS